MRPGREARIEEITLFMELAGKPVSVKDLVKQIQGSENTIRSDLRIMMSYDNAHVADTIKIDGKRCLKYALGPGTLKTRVVTRSSFTRQIPDTLKRRIDDAMDRGVSRLVLSGLLVWDRETGINPEAIKNAYKFGNEAQ